MHTVTSTKYVEETASPPGDAGVQMVVRGRHCEVSDSFRQHVEDKLHGLDRLDGKLYRLDVEVSREQNPRQADHCERVEITCFSRGPIVRAEACAPDLYAALDLAAGKLEERLRRGADRRHSRGSRVAAAHHAESKLRPLDPNAGADPEAGADGLAADAADAPFLVREKDHAAAPMSLDDALASMELVGHDFFLFVDSEVGCPSVVYRRRGYHYGVLRLRPDGDEGQHD